MFPATLSWLGSGLLVAMGLIFWGAVRRVGIAGGDTSSLSVEALGIWALGFAGTLAPGVSLTRVHADDPALDGLLLAGDASGFIDPMTGDGLRFAVRGGELAAAAALHALDDGWAGVHRRLAAARRREFSGKWRFNRALRSLVGSPRALDVAAAAGRLVPRVFQTVIAHAGDCYL